MSRLALVLDSSDETYVRSFIHAIRGKNLVLKVGLKTIPCLPVEEWRHVASFIDLFIDAKLHDIPDQVGDAVALWSDVGAKFITIHCQGGPAMIEAAHKKAQSHTKILGVTVLTSLSNDDLIKMGISNGLESYLGDLVKMSLNSGMSSFVSSVLEVPLIRLVAGATQTFHVCPGIALEQRAGSDQKRVVDLQKALQERVDLLVMGRSLTESTNFMDTLDKVLEIIQREPKE